MLRRVERGGTGEVGCFGDDVHGALHALLATGFRFPK
jgi:carbamoyl-phosphate synthase large subunit